MLQTIVRGDCDSFNPDRPLLFRYWLRSYRELYAMVGRATSADGAARFQVTHRGRAARRTLNQSPKVQRFHHDGRSGSSCREIRVLTAVLAAVVADLRQLRVGFRPKCDIGEASDFDPLRTLANLIKLGA